MIAACPNKRGQGTDDDPGVGTRGQGNAGKAAAIPQTLVDRQMKEGRMGRKEKSKVASITETDRSEQCCVRIRQK